MSKVSIIFGAGPNIGLSVAKKLLSNGFKVVTVSRHESIDLKHDSSVYKHIKADLNDYKLVNKVFDETRKTFGEPNTVIYNAYLHKPSTPQDPFTVDSDKLSKTFNVNIITFYESIKESLKSFDKLPENITKSIILTGNLLNVKVMPELFSLGIGKISGLYLLQSGDLSYGSKGYKFYYADERANDGDAVYNDISGEAAAEFYLALADGTAGNVPVEATFVKGKGYIDFS